MGRGVTIARAVGACLAIAFAVLASGGSAQEPGVPVSVQATLLAKVAAYDKNLHARSGPRMRVLILVQPGNPWSQRAGAQMKEALGELPTIAGLAHDEAIATAPADWPAIWRAQRPSIVYVTPGFGDAEIQALTASMAGVDVLSVGAIPAYVPNGIVLGFDLVSGRPKLLVHLGQARRQRVALGADVLKLMRVYE
jgi:hypothetical protein